MSSTSPQTKRLLSRIRRIIIIVNFFYNRIVTPGRLTPLNQAKNHPLFLRPRLTTTPTTKLYRLKGMPPTIFSSARIESEIYKNFSSGIYIYTYTNGIIDIQTAVNSIYGVLRIYSYTQQARHRDL